MLSAGVESLEKRDFDAFASSMSAVVQELYAGLPAALSAECPARVLGANPEAFVLSCGGGGSGGLPPECQRRTHGLSVRPSSSPERVNSPPQTSRPGLMDLLAEETGGPAREDETRNRNATEPDSLWARPREGAGFPEETVDTVGDDPAPFPLCLEDDDDDYTGGPKEKNMLLTQQRGEPSSSSGLSSLEASPLLQNQGTEDRAKEEVTPENPELQGMATDGTAPFSKTRERSPSTRTGVTLGRSESDVIVAKMAVPGTNTLPSSEPLSLADGTRTIGHSRREDECRSPTGDGTLSAARGVFPGSEARGENFLVYKDQDINMLVDRSLLAQHNEINVLEDDTSAPVLETRISLDARPSDMNFEPSSCICENNLGSGNLLWEESTGTFEVVCQTGEEGQFSEDEIELLEEWAARPKMEESRSPTWSCKDLYEEQETDHSYSCDYKEGVETHNGTGTGGKETQGNNRLDETDGSLVTAANNKTLENGGSVFRDLVLLPTKEESQFSGTDRIEDMSNQPSPPSGGEGLATLAGGNEALLVEVNSSSVDCDPALGNDGVSQTVSMCDQKTEILKTFRVVNLPAADSRPADIRSDPQEEHPERTQRTDEVLLTTQQKAETAFGPPPSLERGLLKSHAEPEMSGLLRHQGAFLSASQNGSSNEGGEMHHGTQKREDDMEDVWSKACSCSRAGLSRLCSALEACCAVSGGVSIVDVSANTEESDDGETGDGSASTRNVISSRACSGDSSDLDRAENSSNPAPSGEVPSTAPLNDEGLVDETENRQGIFGDNLIKPEGITDVNSGAFTCDIRRERELAEDSAVVASDEMETVGSYKDDQRHLLSGKQPCDGDLGKTLHPAELDSLVKDHNGAEKEKYRIPPLGSSSSTDKSPTSPSLEISPTVEKMELPVSSHSDVRCSSGTRDPGEEETVFPFDTEVKLLENISEGDFCRPRDLSERMMVKDTSENTSSTLQREGLFSPEIFSRTSVCPPPCGGVLDISQECLTSKGGHLQGGQDGGGQTKPSVVLGIESPVNETRGSEVGGCPELTRKQTLARFVSSCDIASREARRKKNVRAKGGLKRRRILEIERPLGGISHGMIAKPGGPAQQTPEAGSVVDSMDNRTPHRSLSETVLPKRSEILIRVKSMEAKSPKCFSSNGNQLSGSLGSTLPVFCTSPEAIGLSHSRSRGACESPRTTRKHLLIFRRQPRKACSKVHTPKRPYLVASPACFKSSPRDGHKLIRPAHFPSVKNTSVVLWDQSPKQTQTQTSLLLDVFKPSKYTKETTSLLKKLSALADKLSAPPRNSWKLKPVLNPPAAEKSSRLGSKTLPQLLSSVGGKLNSQWVNANTGCSFKKFGSLSLLLYPLESASLCVLELSGRTPFAFAAPGFPASFHVKTELVPARNFSAAKSLQSVSRASSWRETRARPPSEWTFSFLFSQNVTGITLVSKEAGVLNSPLSARNDGGCTVAYSAPGLQTVLALFSPGCWRLWARKHRLPGQIAPPWRVTFLRFTGASKNSNFSSSDLFSPLPSTLDGGLPTWRRLNSPSIPPSAISPLRSPCCARWRKVTPATLPPPRLYLGVPNSSAMFPPAPDQSLQIPVALKDDIRWEPSFSLSIPEPTWSHLGLSAPEFPVRALDELDVPVPAFPQSNARREEAESEKKPKKVSQIRIRKTIPKPDPNLTPMGLPRPKRLKKTEFSLEEIYTNKNYKSPPATRSLETIFEEPKEKNGALISVSHQKRKRILEFQDFTVPRKRRARGRVKVTGGFTRAQKAALEGRELDVLLVQRLTDLEAFFAEQEELRDSPGS